MFNIARTDDILVLPTSNTSTGRRYPMKMNADLRTVAY